MVIGAELLECDSVAKMNLKSLQEWLVVELGRVDAGSAMADASLLLPTPNGSFRPQWM